MKKLFSYVLALTLLVSTMSVSFAAEFPDVKEKEQVRAVDVLNSLGVIAGFPDGEFKPEDGITRAQVAVMVAKALGYENITKGGKSLFTDMDQAPWAEGAVEVCVGEGILSGYPDGTFKPMNYITFDEAATILVRALGYTPEILPEFPGSKWSTKFLTKATTLGIFDGVEYMAPVLDPNGNLLKAGATRGTVAEMTFNTLNVPIGRVDQNGDYDEATHKDVNGRLVIDDSMLIRLHGKDNGKDVVNGTENTDLNIRKRVGTYCRSYKYLPTDKDIVFLEESTSLVGTFNEDLDKFTTVGDDTYYLPKNKKTNANDKDPHNMTGGYVSLFHNGQLIGEYDNLEALANDFKTTKKIGANLEDVKVSAAVKSSGKSISNVYAVNVWNVTEADLASDKIQTQIKNKTLLGLDFALNKDGEIDTKSFELFSPDENIKTLEDIKEGHVVYAYALENNENKVISKVAVGTTVLENVECTWNNDENTKATLDGTTYERCAPKTMFYKKNGSKFPREGSKVNAKLDAYNMLYWSVPVTAPNNYAVALAAGKDTVYGYRVRLFLADGTEKVFSAVDSELKISGVKKWIFDTDYLKGKPGTLVEYHMVGDKVQISKVVPDELSDAKVSASNIVDGNIIPEDATIFVYDGDTTKPAQKAMASHYGVIKRAKTAGKEIDATYYSDKKKVQGLLVTEGVVEDTYALFKDFSRIKKGTKLDLIVVKEEEESVTVESTIQDEDASDDENHIIEVSAGQDKTEADGTLWKVTYDINGDVSDLTAAVTMPMTTTDYAKQVGQVGKYDVPTTNDKIAKVAIDNSDSVKFDDGSWMALAPDVEYVKWNKKTTGTGKYWVEDEDKFENYFTLNKKYDVTSVTLYDVDRDKAFDLVLYTVKKKDAPGETNTEATIADVKIHQADYTDAIDPSDNHHQLTITLNEGFFVPMTITGTNVRGWFTNLPDGVSAKLATNITGNVSQLATIEFSGTAKAPNFENIEVTIPKAFVKDAASDIVITPRDEVKWQFIGATTNGEVNAVGFQGVELEEKVITVTLHGETFVALTTADDITGWFTHMIAGVDYELAEDVEAGATTAKVKVSGTPTATDTANVPVITVKAAQVAGTDDVKVLAKDPASKNNVAHATATAKFTSGNLEAADHAGASVSAEITVTLKNGATFKEKAKDADLTAWIGNEPAGVNAAANIKLKEKIIDGQTEAVIVISGSPTAALDDTKVSFTLPAGDLETNDAIAFDTNDVKWMIK